jgi:hypothetical protein
LTNDFVGGSSGRSPKPLAVSVTTAAKLLGVGTTTMWGLVASGSEVEALRIGRRTLVTMASLERLVASASAPSRQPHEDAP